MEVPRIREGAEIVSAHGWPDERDLKPLKGREDEVMPELFERMASGESVMDVCAIRGWSRSTLNLWAHSPKWRQKYMEAREALGAFQGERVIAEAERAAEQRDHGKIAGLKVLVDALKWAASKHYPKVYGDRVDVTSGGEQIRGVIALPTERVELGEVREALGVSEGQEVPQLGGG